MVSRDYYRRFHFNFTSFPNRVYLLVTGWTSFTIPIIALCHLAEF